MRVACLRPPAALAAAFAAAVALAFAAAPAAAKPAPVHPSAVVSSAVVSGKSLHFVVSVSFKPPAKAGSSACKGRVDLAEVAPGSGKAPHWSAPLASHDGLCLAKVKGTLPGDSFGDKVSFTVGFVGNDEVAPFSRTVKLKLSPPPPGPHPPGAGPPSPTAAPTPAPGPAPFMPPLAVVYTLADGHWISQSTGGGLFMNFTVTGGAIQKHFSSTGSMLLICDMEDGSEKTPFAYLFGLVYDQALGLDPGGHFSGSYVREFEQEYPETTIKYTALQSVHGSLGATTGEWTFEVTSASFSGGGHTQSGCDGSVTFNANKE